MQVLVLCRRRLGGISRWPPVFRPRASMKLTAFNSRRRLPPLLQSMVVPTVDCNRLDLIVFYAAKIGQRASIIRLFRGLRLLTKFYLFSSSKSVVTRRFFILPE